MNYCCYFCNFKFNNNGDTNYYCNECPLKYNLTYVITTYDSMGEIKYAHIYYNFYHVRLHLKENYTVVDRILVNLPGLPLNPSNVKEKLKLYMLFS